MLQAYIAGLGDGVILVNYIDDYQEEQFVAYYSREEVLALAMGNGTQIEKMLHVTKEGLVAELTISFEKGKLNIKRKPKPVEVETNEISNQHSQN